MVKKQIIMIEISFRFHNFVLLFTEPLGTFLGTF